MRSAGQPARDVFVAGMAITFRSVRQKFALVLVLLIASALLPLAWDTLTVAVICNAVFYAASLLVPYYLLVGLLRWIGKATLNMGNRWLGRAATAASLPQLCYRLRASNRTGTGSVAARAAAAIGFGAGTGPRRSPCPMTR